MCGRYSNSATKQNLEAFGVDVGEGYDANINICPTDDVWAFGKNMRAGKIKWGAEGTQGTLVINARSETAFEKPFFKNEMRGGQRCLVPCDSFYPSNVKPLSSGRGCK